MESPRFPNVGLGSFLGGRSTFWILYGVWVKLLQTKGRKETSMFQRCNSITRAGRIEVVAVMKWRVPKISGPFLEIL